jgi:hypothetical protein
MFPQGIMGAKFFDDEELTAIADAFGIVRTPGEELAPIVLVENDVTIGGAYDAWMDKTGEQYHFPNQYRNRVQEGEGYPTSRRRTNGVVVDRGSQPGAA